MSKQVPCPKCRQTPVDPRAKQCHACRWSGDTTPAVAPKTPEQRVAADREIAKVREALRASNELYAAALRQIETLERQNATALALSSGVDTFEIHPEQPSGTGEATAVCVASDWHIEENVGAEVGSLNVFNLDEAKRRATRFFERSLRLTNMLAQDIRIDTMVLALLGDFITNELHGAENAEKNALPPTEALVLAQSFIQSGIDFLLNHSKRKLVIPCHYGNHSRTTLTTRFSSEKGHSLEYLMYHSLALANRGEPRVQFIIPDCYHSYLKVYDTTLRFHHGHAVKYGGGVGGLTIPANKAIAQWSKARKADYDVFGHFHQSHMTGTFIANGSLVGYNGFALAIKAEYEQPSQTLFLIDKKRGRTCWWPILVGQN